MSILSIAEKIERFDESTRWKIRIIIRCVQTTSNGSSVKVDNDDKYRVNSRFLSFLFGHGFGRFQVRLGRQVKCGERKSLLDSITEITSVGIPSETNW